MFPLRAPAGDVMKTIRLPVLASKNWISFACRCWLPGWTYGKRWELLGFSSGAPWGGTQGNHKISLSFRWGLSGVTPGNPLMFLRFSLRAPPGENSGKT